MSILCQGNHLSLKSERALHSPNSRCLVRVLYALHVRWIVFLPSELSHRTKPLVFCYWRWYAAITDLPSDKRKFRGISAHRASQRLRMDDQHADGLHLTLFADVLQPFASTLTHLDISINRTKHGVVAEWLVNVIGDELPLLRFLRLGNGLFVRALCTYISLPAKIGSHHSRRMSRAFSLHCVTNGRKSINNTWSVLKA